MESFRWGGEPMNAWSSRVSLVRLLLWTGCVICGFILASWTNAQADDRGLLGAVTTSGPTVERVLETATTAVTSTTATPVGPIAKAVTKPVAKVAAVAAKPARVIDETTTAAVKSTTKALSHSGSQTLAVVKTVAPAAAQVVEPVAAVVAPVVGTRDVDPVVPRPVPDDLVEPIAPVVPGQPVGPGTEVGLIGAEVTGAAAGHDPGVVAASPTVEAAATSAPANASRTGDVVASLAVRLRTHRVSGAGDASPSTAPAGAPGRAPQAPGAPSALSGAAGGSASTRSASGGGPDAGLAPALLVFPPTCRLATQSRSSSVPTGPVLEPGSRPG